MQIRFRKGVAVVLVIGVLVALGAVAACRLRSPGTPTPFVADLQVLGGGTFLRGGNLTIPFVNLSLTFSSPSSLDPASLLISVACSPDCSSPFNGTMVPSIELRYSDNTLPHWLATANGSVSTAFTAEGTNPDGRLVGGRPPSTTNAATSIEYGAILTITLPIDSLYALPVLVVILTCEGHPGSTRATLPMVAPPE